MGSVGTSVSTSAVEVVGEKLSIYNSSKIYNNYLLPGMQTIPGSPIIVLSHMLYIFI